MMKRGRGINLLLWVIGTVSFSGFFLGSFFNIEIYPQLSYIQDLVIDREYVSLPPSHIVTPSEVKALYMTSWVAADSQLRSRLIQMIEDTELNSIVIDIKDYSGIISFVTGDREVAAFGAERGRISDIESLIEDLHRKGIYVIGRVTVFQDSFLAEKYPAWAVLIQGTRELWRDRKGVAYIDPGAREVWEYHAAIARAAYQKGFDEINFDYIRYPSDGDVKTMFFPVSGKILADDSINGRASVLEDFFSFLSSELRQEGIVISADIFGLTTIAKNDLGIGQILERTVPYFDYIAPMIYPSHYPPGFLGYENPAEHPYEIVYEAMRAGLERIKDAQEDHTRVFAHLRPWLQDFDLGAEYDAEMVREQINAVRDAGVRHGWMLWDPNNIYTQEALVPFYYRAKREGGHGEEGLNRSMR